MLPIDNFLINAKSPRCVAVRSYGIYDFRSLCEHIRSLPYGRITTADEPLRVLEERKGTCSSKHQLLASIAHDCGQDRIQLVVGIYAMSEDNTPGIKTALQTAGLSCIPEAHCYLKVGDHRADFTGLAAGRSSPFSSLFEEYAVSPDRLGQMKIKLHKQFIDHWAREKRISENEVWATREACITALSSMTSLTHQ